MKPEYTDKLLETVNKSALTHPNDAQTALHTVYGAIIQGDFDLFGESVTDDVEMNICGFGSMNGTWRGRNAVIEATRRNFSLVSSQEPELQGMISQGDSIAVLLRERGLFKSTGEAYNVRVVQWFTFLDGKIKKMDQIVASV